MKNLFITFLAFLLIACSNNGKKSDAYGNFEATEIIISAEANGKLLRFDLEEGSELKDNQIVGVIDTIQLSLRKQQIAAQKKAVSTKISGILAQINVLNEQKKTLLVEKVRIEKLLKDSAATQQQFDNICGQINVIDRQIESIQVQNSGVLSELEAYTLQIAQIDDQIKRSIITNPMNGLILKKFAEPNELVAMGKALYKIADLSKLKLQVYVSENQLSSIKIGQKVKVLIDTNTDEMKQMEGEISWISSQSEFSPKIIQTREERVNLVYAVKILVNNDGSLKIGMPGEVLFN